MSRWQWTARGTTLAVEWLAGRTVLTVNDDGLDVSVELVEPAVVELVDELVAIHAHPRLGDVTALTEQLGEIEAERDAARERVTELEAELRRKLAEVEALKSAGLVSDDRVRAAEAERDAALLRRTESRDDVARVIETAIDEDTEPGWMTSLSSELAERITGRLSALLGGTS